MSSLKALTLAEVLLTSSRVCCRSLDRAGFFTMAPARPSPLLIRSRITESWSRLLLKGLYRLGSWTNFSKLPELLFRFSPKVSMDDHPAIGVEPPDTCLGFLNPLFIFRQPVRQVTTLMTVFVVYKFRI
jgi:hypothetical protein